MKDIELLSKQSRHMAYYLLSMNQYIIIITEKSISFIWSN